MAGERKGGPDREERELLEEALGMVMVPADARRAAENLLAALVDLKGVFLASEAVLRSVPGMTEAGTRVLRLSLRLAQAYMDSGIRDARMVYDSKTAMGIFKPRLTHRATEAAAILMLDPQGRVLYEGLITEGSFGEVPLYLNRVLQLCIVYQAAEVYIAHNHPSGSTAPSRSDILLTDRLMTALGDIGVRLTDHLIFAENGDEESVYSFKDAGLMETLRTILRDSQQNELRELRRLGEKYEGSNS